MVPMIEFRPIASGQRVEVVHDYDEHFTHLDHESIAALLLGHKVTVVTPDHLLLDDGTVLRLIGNDGGCSCNAGCYDLSLLNGTNNIITNVDFDDSPTGDEHGIGEGTYRIFVFADNKTINLATFVGTDGNGYYGTGYHILVRYADK